MSATGEAPAPQPLPTEGTVSNIPGEALANFDENPVDPNTVKNTGSFMLDASKLKSFTSETEATNFDAKIDADDREANARLIEEIETTTGSGPDDILRLLTKYSHNQAGALVDADGNTASDRMAATRASAIKTLKLDPMKFEALERYGITKVREEDGADFVENARINLAELDLDPATVDKMTKTIVELGDKLDKIYTTPKPTGIKDTEMYPPKMYSAGGIENAVKDRLPQGNADELRSMEEITGTGPDTMIRVLNDQEVEGVSDEQKALIKEALRNPNVIAALRAYDRIKTKPEASSEESN